ncbi:MAG: helix-turn-helix transcriptional regulator [Paludibacteraceae bacterium]|jgi:transcriptional regulator with XRE-family HTH domain|nr:helix-turn-helix transcriptional regulator [Paludibacteraceae bacterium]
MYNPEMITILLGQQGKRVKDLAKYLSGNERQPLSNITKEGANPTAETLEKIADFFLVSIDTLFIRNEKLPEVEQVWTFDKRAEYYERAVVAKDRLIQALEFDRKIQTDMVEMQRERIMNLEDEIREMRDLLHANNIKVPRHKPTEHPIPKDAFGWEGERPTGFKEDK